MDIKNLVHTEPLKDKSLWLAVLGPVLVMVGKMFGLDLDTETVLSVMGPIVAFIVSSKMKQTSVAKAISQSANGLADVQKLLDEAMKEKDETDKTAK